MPCHAMPVMMLRGAHKHGMRMLALMLFLLLLPCSCISQEGAILLNIKRRDWRDTLNVLSDWNASHDNPCAWNGISCNKSNAVTTVNLTDASISGNLTSALCGLASLEALILPGNAFHGPFPDGLLECRRLRLLDLSANNFAGRLPSRIYQLSELSLFNLATNNFSGSIPPGFGMLPNLEALFLDENSITGTLPAFLGNLMNLTNFTIGDNPLLGGVIPPELGNLKRLQQLWIYNCSLQGQIPNFFTNLTQLEDLDLSKNLLSGNIPSSLTALSNLTSLMLWGNNLSGQIPSNIDEMRMLSVLDLSANRLSGNIPDGISNLTYLDVLNLFQNQLTGQIPAELGKLRQLTRLMLFENKLTGWLPQSLGTYSSLYVVDLTGLQLEGPLPQHLCRNGMLFGFAASSNNFNGTLPSSLQDCKSLSSLSLKGNQLSGEIPAGLWGSSNLQELFLGHNKFEGQVSTAIGQAKNLARLEINNNRFQGRIPAQVGQLAKLQVFKASNNRFEGPILDDLAGLSLINTLQLDHNYLSGEIPNNISALNKLSQLNLGNNRLTGEIPASLGNIPTLNSLDLSNNFLSGEIPAGLGQISFTVFNVSGNHLFGPIPAGLDNWVYKDGFLGNSGLCGGRVLMLRSCSSPDKLSSQRLASILVPTIVLAGLALCSVFVCCFCIRKASVTPSWKLTSFHSPEVDESYILQNITEDNVIGSGAAGKVYKVTLQNGQVVAVKKIRNTIRFARFKRKGQQRNNEVEAEVEVEVDTLGLIRHNSILKLLCCISSEDADFKLLVYEYMSNGSLSERLHDLRAPETALAWPLRYKIALGAARGLSYMHHDCSPPILHRDVKSTNILLDGNFEAKIADFGLSQTFDNLGDEHSVSGYVGSHGYIAPEYANRLKVSEKSDVYSFGVVLLELVSGMKATGEVEYGEGVDIVKWIRNTICTGRGELAVLDWRILDENWVEEMLRVVRVGLVCTNSAPHRRPSMRDVVEMLVTCSCSPTPTPSPSPSPSPNEQARDNIKAVVIPRARNRSNDDVSNSATALLAVGSYRQVVD